MSARIITAAFDAGKIDAIFAPYDRCHLPGAAVGVAIDGVPVYRKGFGLASLSLPVLLDPAMRMRIGSTSKHMTALAFLLLCEEGRAGIDDEVGKYLPQLHEASRHVTLRQLMSHTSGLRDVLQISLLTHGMEPRITDAQMLDYYRTLGDVEFAPLESWGYNNGGYMLVSAVIERITGETLDEVLSRRLFRPLGMHDTRLQRWDSEFLPNSASLHMVDGKGGYTKGAMGMELTGAGGVVSSIDDMLRWLRHMDSPVVGSPATWELLRTPQKLANGTSTAYGLGLIPGRYRGVQTLWHAGGVVGGNSQMIRIPSAKLDICVAVNRADANAIDLAYRIIDACLEGLEPCAPAPDAALPAGVYLSKRTGRVAELCVVGDSRFLALDAGMPMQITRHPDGAWRLAPMFSMLKQHFEIADASLRLSDFGTGDVLQRIEPSREERLGERAGEYRCEAIGATACLFEEGNAVRLTLRGRHGEAHYDLAPLTPEVWKARSRLPLSPLAVIVTFAHEPDGLLLSADRMRRLRFHRAATRG